MGVTLVQNRPQLGLRKNAGHTVLFKVFSGYSYAGSRLPQGPFWGNNLFPLKVGLRWVFVNGLEWVQKWVKSGFWGAKVGKNGPKPTFAPTWNPFRDFHKNPLFTQFKGGGNSFLKTALRQSRPSIRLQGGLGVSAHPHTLKISKLLRLPVSRFFLECRKAPKSSFKRCTLRRAKSRDPNRESLAI